MKEKLTNNIVLKIASVLFAIAVWLIVLNINDPVKTVSVSEIPVEIINDEAITSLGKSYSVKSGLLCTISISGPRSIVDMLNPDDFTAVADIKDLSLTNSVPIEVELKKNTYKSKVDIIVKTTLKLDIEDIIEKEYEIKPQYYGVTESNYVVTGTSLETSVVVIKAPRSQMEKIKSVVTVVDITGKNDDFSSNTSIKLLDINNKEIVTAGTEIELEFGKVNSTTTVLYKKPISIMCSLPERIDYDTLISGYDLSADSIEVVGRKNVLDTIESIELPIVLDEYMDVDEGFTLAFNIDSMLPEGVYKYTDMEEISVNVFINKQADRIITTNAKNISISNIPDGLEASLVTKGDISYRIRGLMELINNIDVDDIILKVDVGELTEGTHSLAVDFTLPDGISLLEEIYVEVNLASIEDTQDETTSSDESTSQEPTSNEDESTSETESSEEESTTQEETTTPIEEE